MLASAISATNLRTFPTTLRGHCSPVLPSLIPPQRLALPANPRSRLQAPPIMAGISTTQIRGKDEEEEKKKKKKKKKLQVFESLEDVSASLAKYTAELSQKFVKDRGVFTVLLSGGTLFDTLGKLSQEPYLSSVDWGKWHVLWVDERVVPKDHVESNYKLACEGFLSKVPIPPDQIHAINDTLSPEDAADDYETRVKQLVNTNVVNVSKSSGFPKFDLILLGMGPDGHVASLFPGHPLINESQRWVTYIKDSPKPPPERITFTFPVINSAANIALVIVKAFKADMVYRVLGKGRTSDLLPVQMVSPEDDGLIWFLDKEAAARL